MRVLTEKAKWLYKEFGLKAVYETGKDCWIIILLRFFRMFAYGSNSLILALFFASLEFSDEQIGIFMTLTLLGDVLLSLLLTLVADRVGRRRILFGGSLLMVLAGTAFAIFENFWILLLAAVVGVISATGSEIGPFRAIEESTLSSLTTPQTRTSVLSWYVATATLGSSIGSEAAGHIVESLHSTAGWTMKDAYQSMFWVYTGMGAMNMALTLLLSSHCELTPVPQADDEHRESGILLDDVDSDQDGSSTSTIKTEKRVTPEKAKGLIAQISPETRTVLYKLCSLFALDSLAAGMTPWSLINLYVDNRFGLPKDQLGHIVSIAYFLSAFSATFAGPLAQRIGLINTMVFTHLPSSIALGFIPLAGNIPMIIGLIFFRSALSSMDQAPRAAFVASVVKPEERTAVMGINSMIRTFAQSAGPIVTGLLAGSDHFWIAFVVAGTLKASYDLGLWALFVNMKLN